MKAILLATDGSPSAEHALELAIELCQETGARLDVLTVRTLRAHGDADAPQGEHMDLQPAVEAIADAAVEQARDAEVRAAAHTAYGDPAALIAETAEALGVDLIVVGSHGRGGVRGKIMGSVSRDLLGRTRIPTTVVRTLQHAVVE